MLILLYFSYCMTFILYTFIVYDPIKINKNSVVCFNMVLFVRLLKRMFNNSQYTIYFDIGGGGGACPRFPRLCVLHIANNIIGYKFGFIFLFCEI